MSLELVFLDVGGPIYDDRSYWHALLDALRELGAEVSDGEYAAEYEQQRREQGGITAPIIRRFLGAVDPAEAAPLIERRWRYEPDALYPDVLPALETLARRFRLGI